MAFRRFIVLLTAACLAGIGIETAAARVIGTQDYLAGADRAAQLAEVQAALSRAEVRNELVRLGVDPVAAAERINNLSDAELAELSGKLESLPAGGDGILAVIGIVFIVLLILELTGVIDIFKKV